MHEVWQCIRFHDGVAWAFDGPLHAKGAQQMSREGGLAAAKRAVKTEEDVLVKQFGSQLHGPSLTCRFVRPLQGF